MVLESLITLLVIEFLLYLIYNYWGGLSSKLKGRGITVSAFTITFDVGKSMKPRAKRSEVLSKALGISGVINVALLMLIFYWIIIPSAIDIVRTLLGVREAVSTPFVPVVPGVTIKGSNVLYFLVGVSIAVVAHEFFHALTALNEGIKVESWGLGLFLIFPFAYVKIDDRDYSKSSLSSRVKVLSAGVLSNTALALILLASISSISAVIEQHSMVVIYELDRSLGPEAPAVVAGVPTPSVLYDINGTKIGSLSDLRNYLTSIADKPATLVLNISKFKSLVDDVVIEGLQRPELIEVVKPSNMSRLGILVVEALSPSTPLHLYYLNRVFYWTYVVNISLAVFNAAPLIITDGGKILQEVLNRYGLKKLGYVVQWVTIVITVSLLVIGLLRFI
ncbi:MAG: site-2 protease family protein [Sulfolobales archaeon]|nr:site-2 protease family protein [Sulfolobales archaeon]